MTERVLRIGLLGFGTIGSSVYASIERQREAILRATGVDLQVVHVLERDRSKWLSAAPEGCFTDDADGLLVDPTLDVIVEVMGGVEPAFSFLDRALRHGKDVVTANKQLIATQGAPLFELAKDLRRHLRYEAAVGGAIPIIKVMRESMLAAELHTVYGIVNGTTNYILTAMYRGDGDYADTLRKAQELGYAEADPTADVGGGDAAAKMAILGSIAYHSRVTLADVSYEGIEGVSLADVQHAKGFGFVVKLIGAARLIDDRVNVRVYPALVPEDHPLASINGSFNAVFAEGHAIDQIMLMGPGAGGRQTATAVVSDIVGIAATKEVGFLQDCSCTAKLDFFPDELMTSAFFIRMQAEDRAGVLAQISAVFGRHGVSIESMVQKGHGDSAELIFITHPSIERGLFQAIAEVESLSCCHSRPMTMRVL